MTPYVDCAFARKHLDAFVDLELPLADQVLMEAHLRWCTTCAAHIEDVQRIGEAVRGHARRAADAAPSERRMSATRAELVERARVERDRSLATRLQHMGRGITDLRFVWPAVGATAALLLCVGLATAMWRITAVQRPSSLAAMIAALADPGSDQNPLRLDGNMLLPRVLDDRGAVAHAVLDEHASEDEVVAVAAVVTRDGKVGNYELLAAGPAHGGSGRLAREDQDVASLLDAVRVARFAPAQWPGGRNVAVNMVWLFTKTTVRATAAGVDLGVPLSAPTSRRPTVSVDELDAEPVDEPMVPAPPAPPVVESEPVSKDAAARA